MKSAVVGSLDRRGLKQGERRKMDRREEITYVTLWSKSRGI
jgi:hypothetical protein